MTVRLGLVWALTLAACAGPNQLVLGSKDQGCTFSPDIAGGGPCLNHDSNYWVGGTEQDRFVADAQLLYELALSGVSPILAEIYYQGVRIGGWTRWNYTEHRTRVRPDGYLNCSE